MSHLNFLHHPTLRHLLSSEALLGAQVFASGEILDKHVAHIATSLPVTRPGCLLVCELDAVDPADEPSISQLAGVIALAAATLSAPPEQAAAWKGARSAVAPDLVRQRWLEVCKRLSVALVVLETANPRSSTESIQKLLVSELKSASTALHARLVSVVLELGLSGLVEEASNLLGRPLAVEAPDFKPLFVKGMTATPANQQKLVAEESALAIVAENNLSSSTFLCKRWVRAGRRLVAPVVLKHSIAGYVSTLLRPGDEVDELAEYLQAVALAAMVDFSQSGKAMSAFAAGQKALLNDLLSGQALGAADLERVERHFGFDLCDGMSIFAVQVLPADQEINWPEDPYITTETEGTRIYILPHDGKAAKTWQQSCEELVKHIKKEAPDAKVQVGCGRQAKTLLEISDKYREARQALIIGSVIHADKEFCISYGELGVRRLLYLMIDHPEMDRFYAENLAVLEAYDAEWESELVPTLRVYLKEGANLNSAARALFVHRHTLRYRLEQIAEILNVDIDSQEVLLNLQIAFLIKELKGKAEA